MNFRYVTGQSCNSTSRVYPARRHPRRRAGRNREEGVARQGRAADRARQRVACLSSQAQFDKTMSYIKLGIEGGARLAYGGKRPADPTLAQGLLRRAHRVRRGDRRHAHRARGDLRPGRQHPALVGRGRRRWLESMRSTSGSRASIWTHDLDRALRLASRVEAGYVWINGASTHHVGVPFGGYKQSGIGPRRVDRRAAGLHPDQERQRHVEEEQA